MKIQLILPVSQALSPDRALGELFANRAPKELFLANQRMYAQVFYLRKRFKDIRLLPDEESPALALGITEEGLPLDEPVQLSKSAAMKPDRYLYLQSEHLLEDELNPSL